jgi:hypothetical protein
VGGVDRVADPREEVRYRVGHGHGGLSEGLGGVGLL